MKTIDSKSLTMIRLVKLSIDANTFVLSLWRDKHGMVVREQTNNPHNVYFKRI